MLLLLLFLTFSVLVANPQKLLYTMANSTRGLLNRDKKNKIKSLAAYPPPAPRCSFGENISNIAKKVTSSRWAFSVKFDRRFEARQVVLGLRQNHGMVGEARLTTYLIY